jgi:hypothetical protein
MSIIRSRTYEGRATETQRHGERRERYKSLKKAEVAREGIKATSIAQPMILSFNARISGVIAGPASLAAVT